MIIHVQHKEVEDARTCLTALVDKMVQNLIVKTLIGHHTDMVVRKKEIFGFLELTIAVCLILTSKCLVQECELKNITKKRPGKGKIR